MTPARRHGLLVESLDRFLVRPLLSLLVVAMIALPAARAQTGVTVDARLDEVIAGAHRTPSL